MPGTYFKNTEVLCQPCPVGYYCPAMSASPSQAIVQICPNGEYSPVGANAVKGSECTSHSPAAADSYQVATAFSKATPPRLSPRLST